MNLIQKINDSIESLNDSENNVFDFDKELELLNELKEFVNKHINDKNFIENYRTKVEELNKTISNLISEKESLEDKYNECSEELDKFIKLMQSEIIGKMGLLDYLEDEINLVLEIKNFSGIYNLREKIFREFDIKFEVKTTIKDSPRNEIVDYSLFKV